LSRIEQADEEKEEGSLAVMSYLLWEEERNNELFYDCSDGQLFIAAQESAELDVHLSEVVLFLHSQPSMTLNEICGREYPNCSPLLLRWKV
jgi:hypothetical protein